jgi:hypothetical protein
VDLIQQSLNVWLRLGVTTQVHPNTKNKATARYPNLEAQTHSEPQDHLRLQASHNFRSHFFSRTIDAHCAPVVKLELKSKIPRKPKF